MVKYFSKPYTRKPHTNSIIKAPFFLCPKNTKPESPLVLWVWNHHNFNLAKFQMQKIRISCRLKNPIRICKRKNERKKDINFPVFFIRNIFSFFRNIFMPFVQQLSLKRPRPLRQHTVASLFVVSHLYNLPSPES